MKKTMKASEGHICHLNKLQKAVAFQVFGGDIIFDKDFHPYLLELNKGPSMKYITVKDKEMKDRLRYQVNCGTFIDPKYKSRIDACGTKANLKLKKPFNKKLQDVMNSRAGDMPKSIRQVYDELATDEINKDAETVCKHVQKGVSMKSCSNKYNMIGEEDESITDTLRANDSCFDPYSQY